MINVRGRGADRALRSRVARTVAAALESLAVKPVGARVTFFDDDGPKRGPALRCAIDASVPYRAPIHVEHVAGTARTAFDRAMDALDRRLEQYRERDRDNRRHPKKYFVAKQLQAGGLKAPGAPRRVRRRLAG